MANSYDLADGSAIAQFGCHDMTVHSPRSSGAVCHPMMADPIPFRQRFCELDSQLLGDLHSLHSAGGHWPPIKRRPT
jgi:hypothetical protein